MEIARYSKKTPCFMFAFLDDPQRLYSEKPLLTLMRHLVFLGLISLLIGASSTKKLFAQTSAPAQIPTSGPAEKNLEQQAIEAQAQVRRLYFNIEVFLTEKIFALDDKRRRNKDEKTILLLKEDKEKLDRLKKEARKRLFEKDYTGALKIYPEMLAICEKYEKYLPVPYPHLKRGVCLRSLSHYGMVPAAAISPDGKYAVTRSDVLVYWNLETGRSIFKFDDHCHRTISLAFSPDGKKILTGGTDGARYWDLQTGKCIYVLIDHKKEIPPQFTVVAISPDGQKALTCYRGITDLTLWDLNTGQAIRSFSGHEKFVPHIVFHPDGKHVLTGSRDKTVKYWDLETGKCLKTFSSGSNYVTSIDISPNGHYAMLTSASDLKIWSLRTGKTLYKHSRFRTNCTMARFLPNGKAVLVIEDSNMLYMDLRTRKYIRVYPDHGMSINRLSISKDGKYAVTGSDDNTMKYWDLQKSIPPKKK